MKKEKITETLGGMMENAPRLHVRNHDYGFNFNHNTLMQKLISSEITETGFWIHPDDYFKGLIAIDYYTNILSNNNKAIENIETIFEKMKEYKNGFELTSSIIGEELYLSSTESGLEKEIIKIKERYDKKNTVFEKKQPSIYYRIIGEMVYDLVSEEYKEYLENVKSLNDLRALVFIDVVNTSGKTKMLGNAKKLLNKKEYLEASLEIIKTEEENNECLMVCSNCGTSYNEKINYCEKCGSEI